LIDEEEKRYFCIEHLHRAFTLLGSYRRIGTHAEIRLYIEMKLHRQLFFLLFLIVILVIFLKQIRIYALGGLYLFIFFFLLLLLFFLFLFFLQY